MCEMCESFIFKVYADFASTFFVAKVNMEPFLYKTDGGWLKHHRLEPQTGLQHSASRQVT